MTLASPSHHDGLLLGAALGEGPAATRSWADWVDGVDLTDLDDHSHRLVPLAVRNVLASGEGVDVAARARGMFRHTWVRNQLAHRACEPMITALEQRGIPTLLLKGAALVSHYGERWYARFQSDFDVLVPERRLDDALECFSAQGWTPSQGASVATLRTRARWRRHSWGLHEARGAELDLHWHVLMDSLGSRADDAWWTASVPSEFTDAPTRRLCDADLLLHVLEHGGHGEPGAALQWIVDATMILRRVRALSLVDRIERQARAHDVLGPVVDALEVLQSATSPPGAADLLDVLARARPSRRERWAAARGAVPCRSVSVADDLRLSLQRHGGGRTTLVGKIIGAARERVDGGLVRARIRWILHCALGRSARTRLLLRGRAASRPPDVGVATPVALGARLDLRDATVLGAHAGPGWSYPEPQGTWTDGAEARLVIPLDARAASGHDLWLELDFVPALLCGVGSRLRVDVLVNERRLARWDFSLPAYEPGPFGVRVPAKIARRQPLEVALRIHAPRSPAALGLSGDARRVGAQVAGVRIDRFEGAAPR